MENYFYNYIFKYLNPETPQGLTILIVLSVWGLLWKSLGFWKSARSNERLWFIAFLIFQTLGILEILYLFHFAKDKLTLIKIKKNIKIYKFENPFTTLIPKNKL